LDTYDSNISGQAFERMALDIIGIQEYQQNRYPYLFLDVVDEVVPGRSAKGYKNFTRVEH
jgi:3-hydroxyacyl-[acyl-carrier-protein] dehydratase